MKSLVIAEKPSVARDIARVLHCNRKSPCFIEGDNYVVTWGLGHLVTLADPEQYNKQYKEWNLEQLPMLPKKMELVVIKQTSKQYGAVKSLIHRKDINCIIIATDAGREGELVARWILDKANNQKPLKRLWISSVTDKAIKEGFANLKDGKEYVNLYHAAVARAEADWLVGINATRALTCKHNAQLSCGRVQTPTLAMIAAREEEIRQFKPQAYFGLSAKGSGISFIWQDIKTKGFRTFDQARAEEILKKCMKKDGVVSNITKTLKKTFAPGLYDLTELQRDANIRFGFSAKETLNIMQRLYENHKVLTYPRTDSRYISTDVVGTLKDRLRACAVGPYKVMAQGLAMKPITPKKSFVDNAKVSDHHAIIPTEEFVQMANMSNEERKVYDLVVRRFLAVLSEPFEYEQTTITADIVSQTFVAKGKVVVKQGWKAAYDTGYEEDENEQKEDLKEQMLPKMTQGMKLPNLVVAITKGQTKPPAPFNEATLLSAMENPSNYLTTTDKTAAKTLSETGGLGTVATRADIIEKLFNTFLMEKRGKDIFVTSKARQLLTLVPNDLKRPELTADWEMKLQKISKGQLKKDIFMTEIISYSKEIVSEIKVGSATFRHDNLTNTKCPQCGKKMLSVSNKNGKLLVCQDRECGHRERISRVTNARCPVCHKKMELVGIGEKQMFTCLCGHKEKLTAFEERRKKEGAGVSKKDVNNYMNKMKSEAKEPVNNAFAQALKKINLD